MADGVKKALIESAAPPQRLLVFQQNGSGRSKIAGIRRYGGQAFQLRTVDVDGPLPPLLDDARDLLPPRLDADLVLDYLHHPDLSLDLAHLCRRQGVPLVAPGRNWPGEGVFCPPT